MKKIVLALFLLISLHSFSQKPKELGAEYLKTFGKGFIGNLAGARFESYSNKSSWNIAITYNFSARKTYSQYKGFGLIAGYRYALSTSTNGSSIFGGARLIFGFENFEGKTSANSLAITPMAEAGYHLVIGKRIFTTPALGYGYTLKISKDYNSLQEDEGGRVIAGLSAGYRF